MERQGSVKSRIFDSSLYTAHFTHKSFKKSCSTFYFVRSSNTNCRSQWPRGLRLWSRAARLLWSWVRIPPGAWISVCCECCLLSGRGLCDGLITRPEESYRLWCVVVCDLEKQTSWMRRPRPTGGGFIAPRKKKKVLQIIYDISLIIAISSERERNLQRYLM